MTNLIRIEDLAAREIAAGIPMGPFHRQTLLNGAPDSVKRNLELAARYPDIVATRQGFAGMDVNDGATGTFGAINTTTAESSVVGATQALLNQFCAISPDDARAGKVYKVTFTGKYSTAGSAPTVIWTPRWGNNTTVATNVTLGASPTATTIASMTNQGVYGEFKFTILTSPPGGTAGTGLGRGMVWMGLSAATSSQYAQAIPFGGTTATIDTTGQGTAGCGLQITITWGTSAAGNSLTLEDYIVRSLN